MQRILAWSAAHTLASVVISIAMGATLLPMLGGSFDRLALWMCILCPLAIAGPISLWSQINRQRLADLLEELGAAHKQLSETHAEPADAHRRLAEKARHDQMTGMLNREGFFAALEARRSEAARGTLMIIDADDFKCINDRHGHLAGDEALLAIADAIGMALGAGNLCGRIGGEEFAVFLPEIGMAAASQAAERIRRAVEQVVFRPRAGAIVPLSVSIGVSSHRPGVALSDLLREADSRLYQAKRAGKNRIEFGIGQAA